MGRMGGQGVWPPSSIDGAAAYGGRCACLLCLGSGRVQFISFSRCQFPCSATKGDCSDCTRLPIHWRRWGEGWRMQGETVALGPARVSIAEPRDAIV